MYSKPGKVMPHIKDNDYFNNWYVYDGKQIVGPYHAQFLLNLGPQYFNLRHIYVSKKGFDRWYPIKSFLDYFKNVYQEYNNLENQKSQFESSLSVQINKFKNIQNQTVQYLQNINKSEHIIPKPNISSSSSSSSCSVERVLAEKTLNNIKHNNQHFVKPLHYAGNGQGTNKIVKGFEGGDTSQHIKQNKVNINFYPKNIQEAYLLAKGRFRLGDIRNIGIVSIIGFVVFLGFNYFIWLLNISREINWHLYALDKTKFFRSLCACIPLVHLFAVLGLIWDINKLEKQNGYRYTSYFISIILSFIPPFFMMYIQHCLNHHWLLHTKYFMQNNSDNKVFSIPTSFNQPLHNSSPNLQYYAKT